MKNSEEKEKRTFKSRKCIYQHSAGQWSDDEVANYVPADLPSTNKLVSTNQWANGSYLRRVSAEVSKLDHALMNQKQGDHMQFSLEKEDWKKENGFIQPIIPVYGLCYKMV